MNNRQPFFTRDERRRCWSDRSRIDETDKNIGAGMTKYKDGNNGRETLQKALTMTSNLRPRRPRRSVCGGNISRRDVLCATVSLGLISPLLAMSWQSAHAASEAIKPLGVSEIAPGLFVHQGRHELTSANNLGGISNAAFIIGEEAVAVIDTGGSYRFGQSLRAAIKEKTDRPIRYVINTHMHPDHVLGNAAFKTDNPEFVAHYKMSRALAARAENYLAAAKNLLGDAAFEGTEVILPTRSIESLETIDLGGRQLSLDPQPTAHTDNDLLILDERTQTLLLGDLLFVEHIPALDGSILGWLQVIEKLRKVGAARAVPGHGPASVSWPDSIAPEERYLQKVVTDIREIIASGGTLASATKTAGFSEKDAWQQFDDYHARNVSAAFAELEWE